MRKIAFRGWDKENKRMLYNVGFSFNDCGMFIEIERTMVSTQDMHHTLPIENFELMQFIGLHDKNGKEIWEGDIVVDEGYRGVIEYGSPFTEDWKHWPICFYSNTSKFGTPRGLRITPTTAVLGNIYENPELLEQNKWRKHERP